MNAAQSNLPPNRTRRDNGDDPGGNAGNGGKAGNGTNGENVMNSVKVAHGEKSRIGETLPLFVSGGGEPHDAMPIAEIRQPAEQAIQISSNRSRARSNGPHGQQREKNEREAIDRHMQAAWRLAKALKAAKSGHRSGRKLAKLTPGQRHQVGSAICEHLLASLREQVARERSRPQNPAQ